MLAYWGSRVFDFYVINEKYKKSKGWAFAKKTLALMYRKFSLTQAVWDNLWKQKKTDVAQGIYVSNMK